MLNRLLVRATCQWAYTQSLWMPIILLCLVNCKVPLIIFDIYYFTYKNISNMLVNFFNFLILLRLIGQARISVSFFINSPWLGYTIRQHSIGSSLLQFEACRWIGDKPLPKPVVTYPILAIIAWEQTSGELELESIFLDENIHMKMFSAALFRPSMC